MGSPFALLAEHAEHKGQAQEPGNPTIDLRHSSDLDAYIAISETPNTQWKEVSDLGYRADREIKI